MNKEKWFAWYPVRTNKGWTWLKMVYRDYNSLVAIKNAYEATNESEWIYTEIE